MFTHVDVRPVRPEYITHRIAKEVDLLSIRLHDLRHQAATLALAAQRVLTRSGSVGW